jgi:hypothetical protein
MVWHKIPCVALRLPCVALRLPLSAMKCSHNKCVIAEHISNNLATFIMLNNAFLLLACFVAVA